MKQLLTIAIFLTVSQSGFALKPERTYSMTPDSMGIGYKEIRLKTSDGFDINTWIFEPKKETDKKCVLIMSGGDAGNMCYIIYQAYMLSQKGFRVITYDYRGFGKSSDFAINKDYLYYDEFVTDLQTEINYADSNFRDSKIGLYGFSMGTMISGFAAAKNPNISLYIADGFIIDPLRLVDRYKEEDKKNGRQLNLPPHANDYAQIIKALNIPCLIFAGTQDKHTPLEDAEEAIKQQKNRELIVFNGDHGEGFIKLTASKQTGDRYFDDISGFADGWLK
jgi:uncharacterized protein